MDSYLYRHPAIHKWTRRNNKALKQPQERHKAMGFMSKNNASTCAFYILEHFFAVPCKTTTSNDQIIGFCGEHEHGTVNFSFSI